MDSALTVTICICTYRRPVLLDRLLRHAQDLRHGSGLVLDIVVVDNDDMPTAKEIVERHRSAGKLPILYLHEARKSISLARNLAVAAAKGDYIAFIDDDEFPEPGWIEAHMQCLEDWPVDGVLGPVIPYFEDPPPSWILKGKLAERPRHATGTSIGQEDMRTGNAVLRRSLFHEDRYPFALKWGITGGGDTDFFERMVKRGRKFVWCDEGRVFETIPPERLRVSYYLKRGLLRGYVNSRKAPAVSLDTAKSIAASLVYTAVLPFLPLFGMRVFFKMLVSDCDHIGRLLGLLGINPIRERP